MPLPVLFRPRRRYRDRCDRLLLAALEWLRLALPFGVLETGCNERYWVCAGVEEAKIRLVPQHLSETCLYDDLRSGRVATGVRAYRPRFALWSDGAEKRRWVSLPLGTAIDTSDMDNWRFATGTKLWKEFTRDGVRVETRLMAKTGPNDDDWIFMSYVWNADESDALAAPYGAMDARGTAHDVPAANECVSCHGGRTSRVLGFSAVQMSAPAQVGEIALAELGDEGLMTSPASRSIAVPGDETERNALGYLHANCGECHNGNRPRMEGPRCFEPRNELDVWLRTGALASPEETPTYRTVFDRFAERGHPDQSRIVRRISRRGFGSMPCVGSERIDEEGVQLLRRWIAER
jgi:hypothetical protein